MSKFPPANGLASARHGSLTATKVPSHEAITAPYMRFCKMASALANPDRGDRGWRRPHDDAPCSPVILAGPRRPGSRFLKPQVPQPPAEEVAQPPPAPPDPIVSCEDKIAKLKAMLKKRKVADSCCEPPETSESRKEAERDDGEKTGDKSCAEPSREIPREDCINNSVEAINKLPDEEVVYDSCDENKLAIDPVDNNKISSDNHKIDKLHDSPREKVVNNSCPQNSVENKVEVDKLHESHNKISVNCEKSNISPEPSQKPIKKVDETHPNTKSLDRVDSANLDSSSPLEESKESLDSSSSAIYEDEFERNMEKLTKKGGKKTGDRRKADAKGGNKKAGKKKSKKGGKGRKGVDDKANSESNVVEAAPEGHPPTTTTTNNPKKPSKKQRSHHRKANHHFKTDSTTPIYFCPETAKLFVNKRHGNKGHKKKCDIWSINTLVDKYMSFLRKTDDDKGKVSATEPIKFDEARGRLLTGASDESGDEAFSVVFEDRVERKPRPQHTSECDSEDSFVICFDSDCENNIVYTNDDVFDNSWTSDDDDEEEDDDDDATLREPALKGCMKKPRSRGSSPKNRAPKTVTFDPEPATVHKITEWDLEYHLARIGPWQGYARDADRFKQRILDLSMCLDWVFKKEHRNRIFFQRFRPIVLRQEREEKAAKAREAKLKREEEAAEKEKERLRKLEEEEEERLRKQEEEKEKLRKEEEERPEATSTTAESEEKSDGDETSQKQQQNNDNSGVVDEKSNYHSEFSNSDSSTELIEVR